MDQLFQVGSFCFRLLCPDDLPLPSNFLLFETEKGQPEYTYRFSLSDTLSAPDGEILANRPDLLVRRTSLGESRMIGIRGKNTFYACYRELSDHQADITLDRGQISSLQIDPVFASLFALERRMIGHDSLILHCAYVEYQGKALLFSAPSETGKSTQADLWERFRGSRTINGDRALLRKVNGRWTACGWPVCGSSGICTLGDTPIHAIVMLGQSETNQACRLSPVQAFSQLYAQITINQWNRDFVQRAMGELEELIGLVPVYQLLCNMTEGAVRCLENALFPTEQNLRMTDGICPANSLKGRQNNEI